MGTHESPWLVLKFGGTSVSDAANWETIAAVLRDRIASGYRPVVVHSALTGVTADLESLASRALEEDPTELIRQIDARHDTVAAELGISIDDVRLLLEEDREALRELVEGVVLVKEVTPRTRARLLAFGERMATRLGAESLTRNGIDVTWLDARDLLKSVEPPESTGASAYLSAECDADHDPDLVERLAATGGVPVTQGFTARNADGETVVLGRGGSDTAAAYFAGKLSAERLEIWTDVPGMFTADPRVVPSARLLRQLDYREAQEIATTGSRVLHPRCIPALRDRAIPIRVFSTSMPLVDGTVIRRDATEGPAQLKAISCKKRVVVVSMETVGMWQEVGFLASAFDTFRRLGISIDLVSTSETNVTVSLDQDANALEARAVDRMMDELNLICRARLIPDCAAVSLVGRNIRGLLHRLGPALEVFEQHRIHLLSQAASDLNLTVVVDQNQADRLVRLLHAHLVAEAGSPEVFGTSWEQLQPGIEESRSGAPRWWELKREALLEVLGDEMAAYVYDLDTVDERLQSLRELDPVDRVLYAMKANSNPEILERVRACGGTFECVSPGEIERVLECFPTIDRSEILFTPNFAPRDEYRLGLELGVQTTLDSSFPLRSWPDLFQDADLFLRIDPGVGRGHHDKVRTAGTQAKFGIPLFELEEVASLVDAAGARVVGVHAHSGSGILTPEHWAQLAETLSDASTHFPDVTVLDVGGGLGVPEKAAQEPLDLTAVATGLASVRASNPGKQIWIEPGRFVVAESGVLLARVTQTKGKGAVRYVGVGTGMNSLIRPALYGSYHEIVNLTRLGEEPIGRANVVGPICETGDTLGLDRLLPETSEGDVLLIANTGAYGFVMASRYNLREPAPQRYL
jgi:diaminopimelate decarboxylase/aspartate kinase